MTIRFLVAAVVSIATLSCVSAVAMSKDARIDATLHAAFEETERGETISALVFLAQQSDIPRLASELDRAKVPFHRRNREVVRQLRDTAAVTQADLLNELATARDAGEVASFEPFWIANIVKVEASEAALRRIAQRPDVQRVYHDFPIEGIEPIHVRDAADNAVSGSSLAGLEAVRAPEVWAMGYTGNDVLIATIDSGVDGDHPALESRWRGLDPAYEGNPQWAWFDPLGESEDVPVEFAENSHGTHTMGTILGGAPGEEIGVAPDAQWIQAAAIDRGGGAEGNVSNAIASFQWMAAPTGNAEDSWAVPRVCSNSWGILHNIWPECDEAFWQWIDNSEAAGTAHFFAAGNEGHWDQPLRRPADRATTEYQSVAIGSIDPHVSGWPISYFSSRGPTYCTPDGSAAIKPDISAPGWDIRSSVDGGGYVHYAGTSMAAPHVAGVATLMLDACEHLTTQQIKQILYDTAVDLGDPGKDNDYGWGMIDAVEAVNLAMEQCTLGMSVHGIPETVPPGEAATFTVQVDDVNETVVPGSEVLMYRANDGPFDSIPLQPLGDGDYEATLPAAACDDDVQFYVQVEGDGGSTHVRPLNAPEETYSVEIGDVYAVDAYHEDFEQGLPDGWTTTGLWKITDQCPIASQCAGTQWAYYGQTGSCSYDNGFANSGEMTSAQIAVPELDDDDAAIELSFCYSLDSEVSTQYDRAIFTINDGEEVFLENSAEQWTTYTIDASAYAGEAITLRWRFETIDDFNNDFHGWQISDVRVSATEFGCQDPPCNGDLNDDGFVNVSDLLALLDEWGDCAECDADLNGDGTVNVSDLLQLLGAWGDCL